MLAESIVSAKLQVVQPCCVFVGCWCESALDGRSSEHFGCHIFTRRIAGYAEYIITAAWHAVCQPSARYTLLACIFSAVLHEVCPGLKKRFFNKPNPVENNKILHY